MKSRSLTSIGTGAAVLASTLIISGGWAPWFAAFPGTNGRIVFDRDAAGNPDIYSMSSDGTDQVQLTDDEGADTGAVWSPDASDRVELGPRRRLRHLHHGRRRIRRDQPHREHDVEPLPRFSPDGTRIAFGSYDGGTDSDVWVMNVDGSGATQITDNEGNRFPTGWSVDDVIAFSSDADGDYDLFRMDADGSDQTRLTSNVENTGFADWSPDGSQLVYRTFPGGGGAQLFVMAADGSGIRRNHQRRGVAFVPGLVPRRFPDRRQPVPARTAPRSSPSIPTAPT